jgi:hypothetical protein
MSSGAAAAATCTALGTTDSDTPGVTFAALEQQHVPAVKTLNSVLFPVKYHVRPTGAWWLAHVLWRGGGAWAPAWRWGCFNTALARVPAATGARV